MLVCFFACLLVCWFVRSYFLNVYMHSSRLYSFLFVLYISFSFFHIFPFFDFLVALLIGSCDQACLQLFADQMRQFLIYVRNQYQRIGNMNVKLFWKGTLLTKKDLHYGFTKNKGALFLLDKVAQQIASEFRIPYVNASDVIQYIPRLV